MRWQFETGAGKAAFDSATGLYHGTLQNGVVWSDDAIRGAFALQFDGVDDFMRVPHYDELTFGTSAEFALTMWVKTTATTDSQLISKRASGAYPYDLRLLSNGTVQFARSDGATVVSVTSTASINDGSYHFIAAVKRGAELHIYVDGNLSSTVADSTTAPTINTEVLRLAVGSGVTPFDGSIDDARIYDVTLCDSDVVAIMNEP